MGYNRALPRFTAVDGALEDGRFRGAGFAVVLPRSLAFGANQNKSALALILRKDRKKYRGILFMHPETEVRKPY